MAKIDVTKEEISYLKLWLGIAVITDISVFSWLITNAGRAASRLSVAALIAAVAATSFIFYTHKRIAKRIRDLEDL